MSAAGFNVYTRAMTITLKLAMAFLLTAGAAGAAQTASKDSQDGGTAMDVCEKVALAKVQGRVLERRAQKYPTGFNYEYLIAAKDGRKLVVEVDGKTRKVFAVMDSEPAAVETGEEELDAPAPE
jgi:hypothetical protein